MARRRSLVTCATTSAVFAAATLAGCGATAATKDRQRVAATVVTPRVVSLTHAADSRPARLPGLGPVTLDRIPRDAQQVVIARGAGLNSPDSTVTIYELSDGVWQGGMSWQAHNALRGWTTDHHLGDLRSPIGVYTLTDAGGLLPNPGTRLPYTQSSGFTDGGRGFVGESLADAFDYVVAINYNRVPGRSPLDWARPMGASRGGGVWFHVDHGGPTEGCVSVSEAHMRQLLLMLDPARHPVVVIGDTTSLAR